MIEFPPSAQVDTFQLHEWIAAGEPLLMIDLREVCNPAQLGGDCVALRLHQLPAMLFELPRDRKLILCCDGGRRSLAAAHYLRQEGFDAWALRGGFEPVVGTTESLVFMEDR